MKLGHNGAQSLFVVTVSHLACVVANEARVGQFAIVVLRPIIFRAIRRGFLLHTCFAALLFLLPELVSYLSAAAWTWIWRSW